MTQPSSKQFTITHLRISENKSKWMEKTVDVAVEAPFTINIEDVDSYTILCSPDDRRAMAVGFMFSESIIRGIDDIVMFADCLDSSETMRVRLKNPSQINTDNAKRNLLVVSSCGMCGSTDIQSKIAGLPRVPDSLTIGMDTIDRAITLLNDKQNVFKRTKGTHAVLIFDGKGNQVSFAEDIGRHNAFDKAIGNILLSGKTAEGCGAVLSGRVSFEMVSKCSLAGIEIIIAFSAPTSLALEAALHCGITLYASIQNDRMGIFSFPERINHL